MPGTRLLMYYSKQATAIITEKKLVRPPYIEILVKTFHSQTFIAVAQPSCLHH